VEAPAQQVGAPHRQAKEEVRVRNDHAYAQAIYEENCRTAGHQVADLVRKAQVETGRVFLMSQTLRLANERFELGLTEEQIAEAVKETCERHCPR
jgi:hypothetical protein